MDHRVRRAAARRTHWTYRSWDAEIYDASVCDLGMEVAPSPGTTGPRTLGAEFVIWAPGVPSVVGPPLVCPWWNFYRWWDPSYELADGTVATIRPLGGGRFGVEVGTDVCMTVGPTSVVNHVSLYRGDREIGIFPPFGGNFRLDLRNLDERDLQLVLLVIGSRLPTRARRGPVYAFMGYRLSKDPPPNAWSIDDPAGGRPEGGR